MLSLSVCHVVPALPKHARAMLLHALQTHIVPRVAQPIGHLQTYSLNFKMLYT